ncbi:MAG: acyltransferase [Aquihabitans sp.]
MTAAPAVGPNRHLVLLDGLRGAAVLLVVAYHASYLTAGWGPRILPGGFIGVDLFFVLSGFLITRQLATALIDHGSIDLSDFAGRRVRRLVPALVTAVVGTLVLLWITGDLPATRVTVTSALGALLYVNNIQQARGWTLIQDLSHTWSLAIEAQYYLVWPLVLLGFHRLRASRRTILAVIIVAMVAISVRRAQMWTDQAHFQPLYLGTDTRIDVLLAGSLLGLLAAWGHLRRMEGHWLRVPVVGAVAVFALVSLFSETGDHRLYDRYGLVAVTLAAMTLVVSSLVDPEWSFHRVWRIRVLRWLGLRSYSLYLWHVPIFLAIARNLGDYPTAVKVLLGLTVALGLAELSYRFVEQPFRRRRSAGRKLAG